MHISPRPDRSTPYRAFSADALFYSTLGAIAIALMLMVALAVGGIPLPLAAFIAYVAGWLLYGLLCLLSLLVWPFVRVYYQRSGG